MALKDIRELVGQEIGQTDLDLNADALALVDRFINDAAREIWTMTDLPGCLREVYLNVMANKRIALPPFIGEIRKLREADLGRAWKLEDMRPRYHLDKWASEWDNWVFVGYEPFASEITNVAPLVYKIHAADSTLTVTTTGSTLYAARVSETIIMDATSKTGTENFLTVESVVLNKTPSYDVTVEDVDGNEMAKIYTYMTEARYVLLDVSKYPSLGECADGSKTMEVLYKMPLKKLVTANDTFPLPDYDRVVAFKAIQLHCETQEGKEDRARLMMGKINLLLNQLISDKKSGIENAVRFERNPWIYMMETASPYQEYPPNAQIYPARF